MDLAARRLPTLDRRVVDAVAVLACLVLTAFAVKASWSPLPRPVIALAGTIGSLVQWRRRQWPQAAALVGSAAYALSGNPGPLLIGLYTGASLVPRRQVWAPAIAGWAGIAGLLWIDAGHLNLNDIAYAALIAGFVVAVGVYVATRRALTASLRERADRAEVERELREEQARADERTRIAREMHDVLAHKMSLIALHAGALELQSTGTPPQIQVMVRYEGGMAVMGVADDGIGVEAEWKERIFLPLQRRAGAEAEGSGIGLATCKKIVTRAGGRIWVESQPGQGATFYFTLPARGRSWAAS